MGIKVLKPMTPGTRFYSVDTFEDITTNKPYKPLLEPLKNLVVVITLAELLQGTEAVGIKDNIVLLILKEKKLIFQLLFKLLNTTQIVQQE